MTNRPLVALVGTLDTKGPEYAWIAERLREAGVDVHVVDAGIRPPRFAGAIDTAQDEVALTAVPYFAWANRGFGAMRVWVPLAGQAAVAE